MNFALFIWSELTDLINSSDKKEDKSETQREKVTVQVVTENGLTLIDPQYCFYVDNRIVSLSDILTLNVPVGNKNVLTLSGPRASIREYIKRIGRATKAGDIILCDRRVLHQTDKKVRCHLPVSVVESIARSLPIQPWPKAVHKQIASSLGISNTQASAAIRLILETPNLKALIGKDLEATKPRNDISDKSQGNIGINNDSRAENDKDVAS